jgi:hypothetical protein
VVTLEDLENEETTSNLKQQEEEEDDDTYREEFLKQIKRKDYLDKQLKTSMDVFGDSTDTYLVDFEKQEAEAESFLEKEKRK